MPRDYLAGVRPSYDVIVIGSGLAGMTAANLLARSGWRVLLLEQHYKLGGLATWFRRPGGHIFDISLHGFPCGMIKSCRRYWNQHIADAIVPLHAIRFENPQFSLTTRFDQEDFRRILIRVFGQPADRVDAFFREIRSATFHDTQLKTVGDLMDHYFPGRADVVRFLVEPIHYANGTTLEDPAQAYAIVFGNFMRRGGLHLPGGGPKRSSA